MINLSNLIETTKELHDRAIFHPFLNSVADNSIFPEQFNTWIAQDYQYVREFTRFIGFSLSHVPTDRVEILLTSCVAVQNELSWFKAKAIERGIDFNVQLPRENCVRYISFMREFDSRPYWECILAYWAMEYTYNTAWRNVALKIPPSSIYFEFANRWGSDEFSAFVTELGQIAEAAMAEVIDCNPNDLDEIRMKGLDIVNSIWELEVGFWEMAYI